MATHEHPVQIGTNPRRLYTLKPNERIFDFNVRTSPYDLKVDETLADGEGITPGIRYIPSATIYEALVLRTIDRPWLRRIAPWVRDRPRLHRLIPWVRERTYKVRIIEITKKQYDQLHGSRRSDNSRDN